MNSYKRRLQKTHSTLGRSVVSLCGSPIFPLSDGAWIGHVELRVVRNSDACQSASEKLVTCQRQSVDGQWGLLTTKQDRSSHPGPYSAMCRACLVNSETPSMGFFMCIKVRNR